VGCDATLPAAARAGDLTLFGEGPSRVLVAVEARHAREFEGLMAEVGDPVALDRDDRRQPFW